MIYTLWEFIVPPEHRNAFETAYSSEGVWAQFFRRDPSYHETILLRDASQVGRYVTLDVWDHRDSYLKFKGRFADEYQKIDEDCEKLTASERHVGIFERA